MAHCARSMWPVAAIALALAVTAFQAPWIGRPLDPTEHNLGHYFGLAAKVWEHYGFLELRGAPFWQRFPPSTLEGFVYLNHPPGVFWLMYACGTEEWALRLPGIAASWVAGVGLFRILESRFGVAIAAGVALGFVWCPGVATLSVGSYENVVLAFGLWLWVVSERLAAVPVRQPRGLLVCLQVTLAVVGTWMDWMFAFYALALVALIGGRPWLTVRRLWLPGAGTVASAGLVVLWQEWVRSAPFARQMVTAPSIDALGSWFGDRSSLPDWLQAAQLLIVEVAGWPAVGLGAIGAALLAVRHVRLFFALAIAGLSPVIALSKHALDHAVFYTLATPLVFCAAAALLAWLARRSYRLALVVAALLAAGSLVSSWRRLSAIDTTIMRDLGALLESEARRDGGGRFVLTDFPQVFQYYVREPMVLPLALSEPWMVEPFRNLPPATKGARFLWWRAAPDSSLGRYLSGFVSEPAAFTPAKTAVEMPAPNSSARWVTLPPP